MDAQTTQNVDFGPLKGKFIQQAQVLGENFLRLNKTSSNQNDHDRAKLLHLINVKMMIITKMPKNYKILYLDTTQPAKR